MKDVFVHATSMVETHQIGEGTRIWAFTHLMEGVSVGAHCNIGEHCFIETRVRIGDNVTVKNGNMLWEGVVLEDGVFVGPNVFFTNDRYPRSPRLAQARRRYKNQSWLVPTLVREGASLGGGAVIIAGTTIGEFALVGAGSVVTRDVPPYALVTGNPARVRGWVCQCGQPIKFSSGATAQCSECELRYVLNDGAVRLAVEPTLRRSSSVVGHEQARGA
jgi:acetyltransferase-like isoleucine patch superfamily enzyme